MMVPGRQWVGCVLEDLTEVQESVPAGINFSVQLACVFWNFLSAATLSHT
jgi:hypothetical protein